MSEDKKIYVPSHPLPGPRSGAITKFEPGTRTLEAGFKIAYQFRSLPVDITFEKDVAVELRDDVTIYVDVFRPAGTTASRSTAPLPQHIWMEMRSSCAASRLIFSTLRYLQS